MSFYCMRIIILQSVVRVLLGTIACFLMVGAALAAPFDIEVPEQTYRGEPFLVSVSSPLPMENVAVAWLGKEVPAIVRREGDAYKAVVLLGTDVKRKYKPMEPIAIRISLDGQKSSISREIRVSEKTYPVQRLSVDPNMVQPPKKYWPRIEEESRIVGKALATITAERFWNLPMIRPTPGRISSIYGLRRVFNGQPRTPHRGLDIAAPQGELVLAVDEGLVVLTGDHYYAGQSVYLDHGQGVISAYLHLSKTTVTPGQVVSRGETIGQVGSTGRVTGPHLHFGLYVLGQAVDPEPLLSGVN